MSGVTSNLVPETLGCDDSNLSGTSACEWSAVAILSHLIADPLVGLEVERKLGVVTLNDDLCGLLDSLCADATHFCDCVSVLRESVGRGELLG